MTSQKYPRKGEASSASDPQAVPSASRRSNQPVSDEGADSPGRWRSRATGPPEPSRGRKASRSRTRTTVSLTPRPHANDPWRSGDAWIAPIRADPGSSSARESTWFEGGAGERQPLPVPQGESDSNADAPLFADGLARLARINAAAPMHTPPSADLLYVNPTDGPMPQDQIELWEAEVYAVGEPEEVSLNIPRYSDDADALSHRWGRGLKRKDPPGAGPMRCLSDKGVVMQFSSETRRAPKIVRPNIQAGETTCSDQSYVSGLAPWWTGANQFVLHVFPHLTPSRWYEMAVLLNQIRPGEKAVLGCAWDGTRGTQPRLLIPPVKLRNQTVADEIKKYDPSKHQGPQRASASRGRTLLC